MRILRVLVVALLMAAPAAAQHAADGAGGSTPDVPEGPARVHGQIVRDGRPDEVGDVEVVLYALPQGAAPGLRKTRTEADGRFAFERITNDPNTAYLVGARVGEVPFPGERLNFKSGELDHEVTIRISEPTTDAAAISPGALKLRLDSVGGRLVVTETQQLKNATGKVFYVTAAERAQRAPGFRTLLPKGASDLAGPLGIMPDGLVRRDDELVFYGPIYPGEQELTFSYALAAAEGTSAVRRRVSAGASGATLLVPEKGPSVAAPALKAGENVVLDGRTYRTLVTGALRPGAELALEVTLPAAQSDPAALTVQEVRVFLEQDGAALTVREEHHLVVAGDRMLVSRPGETLYAIALPDDARDIRFATEPAGIALVPGADGGIDVAGPIPAGASSVELLYQIPVAEGRSEIALASSRAIPLLSIFVADTGLALQSERLHRRRPVRTEDRTYLYLEAFEVEPGEKVAISITSLDRSAGAGRSFALALAVGAAAIMAALLMAPLRRAASTEGAVEAEPEARGFGERESLYAAMRDLEEDFETGKLSEADHTLLREELRGRAAALLQTERETKRDAPRTVAAATPAARFCTHCGVALGPHDRFCAQCGTKTAAADTASREASA